MSWTVNVLLAPLCQHHGCQHEAIIKKVNKRDREQIRGVVIVSQHESLWSHQPCTYTTFTLQIAEYNTPMTQTSAGSTGNVTGQVRLNTW